MNTQMALEGTHDFYLQLINSYPGFYCGWFVVFGLNDPLGQYFSLYRVVSQREGETEEKG